MGQISEEAAGLSKVTRMLRRRIGRGLRPNGAGSEAFAKIGSYSAIIISAGTAGDKIAAWSRKDSMLEWQALVNKDTVNSA